MSSAKSLFREILREARQHHNYNIREYIKRYARDEFRKHATETDRARITEQLAAGQEQLAFIRRSVTLEQLYGRTQRTAVEVGVKPTS